MAKRSRNDPVIRIPGFKIDHQKTGVFWADHPDPQSLPFWRRPPRFMGTPLVAGWDGVFFGAFPWQLRLVPWISFLTLPLRALLAGFLCAGLLRPFEMDALEVCAAAFGAYVAWTIPRVFVDFVRWVRAGRPIDTRSLLQREMDRAEERDGT